ncbi:head-tail connector protein [Halalkalibacter alkalisediminis]|uniref:Head-tail connector protein n=1 Tax=Halalkalibacter alkalisediminis TaxID=935616 RepID=A0ABV6NFY9_9BACI|nr:head-tail connector protein [Halalkalibacter alkalisediminis]
MTEEEVLALVKQYSRVDFEEDNFLLSSLISSAEEYIFNATGYTIIYEKELEKLAVALLVNHFYENRNIVADKYIYQMPKSIESILRQLEYCYDDDE